MGMERSTRLEGARRHRNRPGQGPAVGLGFGSGARESEREGSTGARVRGGCGGGARGGGRGVRGGDGELLAPEKGSLAVSGAMLASIVPVGGFDRDGGSSYIPPLSWLVARAPTKGGPFVPAGGSGRDKRGGSVASRRSNGLELNPWTWTLGQWRLFWFFSSAFLVLFLVFFMFLF
jgi:hypothetical protein